MPICEICQGDGVLMINNSWFCLNHINEGFIFAVRMVADLSGWDADSTEADMREYLEQEDE